MLLISKASEALVYVLDTDEQINYVQQLTAVIESGVIVHARKVNSPRCTQYVSLYCTACYASYATAHET